MIKRAFDLIVSIAACIVTLPLWLFIAVGVKLSSAGPVLFRQQRVGRFGRPFTLYKFRSMRTASVQPGPCISTSNDPRITRFGQYLRASKMDELPQLINVIKGDMSLVGPRPEVPEIVKLYTPEQAKVLSVRPGLVGPAQIIGRSESSMFPKDVKDPVAYYIKHILPDKLVIDLEYSKQARLL
ncbi:sugar transferase, partial [bacterium]|nr:sugar transferase [bacterium]